MNYNKTGELSLQNFNNNLVLTFNESIGTIFYNLEQDDFNPDEYSYYFFNCFGIYFRLPGEHVFENKKYDMELQFNCTGIRDGIKKVVFVAIPVEIVKNYHLQSKLFENFYKNMNKSNNNILIESFDEALNPFNMFSKSFFYKGVSNFPPCVIDANWIVIENVLYIKEKIYNKLFQMLDKNQIEDGNYRNPSSQKIQDYYILENKFEN